jgi:hypothetical protein
MTDHQQQRPNGEAHIGEAAHGKVGDLLPRRRHGANRRGPAGRGASDLAETMSSRSARARQMPQMNARLNRRSARAPARCRSRQGPCISGNSARMSLRGIAGLLPGIRQARAEGRAVPHMALTCECVGGTHRGRGDDDREYARARDSPKKAPATPIRGSAWPARSGCAWKSGPTRTPRCWVLRPEYSQVMIRLRP